MGRRGPPRTPTPILKLHGSRLVKPREGKEPIPPSNHPKSQTTMNARERRLYNQVCEWLKSMGLQSSTDGNAIARYAKNVVRYNMCCEYLEEHGETFPVHGRNPDGSKNIKAIKRFPQSIMRNELEVTLWRAEREFGLTPAARAGIEINLANSGPPERMRRVR